MDDPNVSSSSSSGPYPGPLLGAGRTAEVFAWGDGQVLKLYRPGMPRPWVDEEARIGRIVAGAGLAAPAAGDIVEVDGRPGIVYERVEGLSLLDTMATHHVDIPALARQFAAVHAQMHHCLRPELPSQRAALQGAIHFASPLPAALKLAMLDRLDRLPDGQTVCHGDYHPGNVVVAQRGLVVIDWMTAGHGHPVADVAATTLLFRIARVPDYYSTETREAVDQARRAFYGAYLAAYLGYRPFPVAEIESWIPVLAAARLSSGIAEEEQDLLALVEAG